MIAIATLSGSAAYALFLAGGESRFFASCMAVLAMCTAIAMGG